MAESADALASGASGGNPVKVQILSPAPLKCYRLTETPSACFVFLGSDVEELGSGIMLLKRNVGAIGTQTLCPQNGGLFNQASIV